jgi:hypothetical protein
MPSDKPGSSTLSCICNQPSSLACRCSLLQLRVCVASESMLALRQHFSWWVAELSHSSSDLTALSPVALRECNFCPIYGWLT